MPSGRPRKPIEQKIAEGTYRRDRDGPIDCAVTTEGEPVAPDWLAGEALEFWSLITPQLVKGRVAGKCDSSALAMLCWWYAEFLKLIRTVDETRKAGKTPSPAQYVALGVTCDKWDKLASKFGLSPADRAKLKIEPQSGPVMPVAPRAR